MKHNYIKYCIQIDKRADVIYHSHIWQEDIEFISAACKILYKSAGYGDNFERYDDGALEVMLEVCTPWRNGKMCTWYKNDLAQYEEALEVFEDLHTYWKDGAARALQTPGEGGRR